MTAGGEVGGGVSRRLGLLLFLVVLLLRISIAAQFPGNYDSESFAIVADAVLDGENVYAATHRYNYSPVWSYVVALIWAASKPSWGLFVLLLGLLQTAVDVASAWLVFRIFRRFEYSPDGSRRAALLFFSNPVSVLVSNAHGQFDGLSILFLVAAVLVAIGPDFERKQWRVAALLGCSLLVKHLTLFHPLLFWRRIRRPGLSDAAFTAPYALLILSFLPFAAAWPAILRNVFLYSAGVSPGRARKGALQSFLTVPGAPRFVFGLVFVAVLVFVIAASRRIELPRSCLLVSLTTFLFLPNASDQSMVWPIVFGSLYPSPAYGLFSSLAGLWYWAQSLQAPLPLQTTSAGVWIAGLLWFVLEMSRGLSGRHPPISAPTRP